MTTSLFESVSAGSASIALFFAMALFLIGCVLTAKLLKGDIEHHSVPWIPWLIPGVAFLAAAGCAYLVMA